MSDHINLSLYRCAPPPLPQALIKQQNPQQAVPILEVTYKFSSLSQNLREGGHRVEQAHSNKGLERGEMLSFLAPGIRIEYRSNKSVQNGETSDLL